MSSTKPLSHVLANEGLVLVQAASHGGPALPWRKISNCVDTYGIRAQVRLLYCQKYADDKMKAVKKETVMKGSKWIQTLSSFWLNERGLQGDAEVKFDSTGFQGEK